MYVGTYILSLHTHYRGEIKYFSGNRLKSFHVAAWLCHFTQRHGLTGLVLLQWSSTEPWPPPYETYLGWIETLNTTPDLIVQFPCLTAFTCCSQNGQNSTELQNFMKGLFQRLLHKCGLQMNDHSRICGQVSTYIWLYSVDLLGHANSF